MKLIKSKSKSLFLFLAAILFLGCILFLVPKSLTRATTSLSPVDNVTPANNLLQFTSDNHILGFQNDAVIIGAPTHMMKITFVNPNTITPTAAEPTNSTTTEDTASPLSKVTYQNIWDGIDIVYESQGGSLLKSTYSVDKNISPDNIKLTYNRPVSIDENNNLTISYDTGIITESAPIAWQEINNTKIPVKVSFNINDKNEVGFILGTYNQDIPLIIDPTYDWISFVGGSTSEYTYSAVIDTNGNVYIAGYSEATWGSPVIEYTTSWDAFVVKIDSSGNLTWNTFLGGSATNDVVHSIAVDGSGNVYVAGTSSATWGTPVRAYTSNTDGFAAKLDSSGNLTWNSFLGGSGNEVGYSIDVDGSGNVYVGGDSDATWGTPVRAYTSSNDGFAAKLDSSGNLTWNSFLGGSGIDSAVGIGIDASGNVYVGGDSDATWGTPVRAYTSNNDGFAAKLDSSGALTWNTFLGGIGNNRGFSIAVDVSGNVYVGGDSDATWGTPVRAYTSSNDGFAAKLDSSGNLTWNSFLGGSGNEVGHSIAVDGSGNVYVAGTSSATWGTPVRAYTSSNDGFAAKLDSSGNLTWNSFLGGSGIDSAVGIGINASGNVYVVGSSLGTWGTPLRSYTPNGYDIFAIKLDSSGILINLYTDNTITASAGSGGSISPDGDTIVAPGESQSYTISLDPRYYVSSVHVDGQALTNEGILSYDFTNVLDNHSIAVIFSSPNTVAGANNANISYNFGYSATSTISYGLTDSYGSSISGGIDTTSHSATITDLEPDTTYHYKVTIIDGGDNEHETSDLTFTTSPAIVDNYHGTTVLYGADGAGSNSDVQLYTIDKTNGEATPIGYLGHNINGMAFHPVTGVLYGVSSNQDPDGGKAKSLFTIDPETAETTWLGTVKDSENTSIGFPDISFRSDGRLYGFWPNSGYLYSIDLTCPSNVCLATKVSENQPDTDGYGGGLAFDSNDHLYELNTTYDGDVFYKIDPDTAEVLETIPLTNISNDRRVIGAAAFDGSNNLYMNRSDWGSSPSDLAVVNTSTGFVTTTGDNNEIMIYMTALAFYLEPDITAPVISNIAPASETVLSSSSLIVTFTTDEVATCRVSLSDESYADMSNDVTCSGSGTTSQSCELDLEAGGTIQVYVACADPYGNSHTQDNNIELSYTAPISVTPTPSSIPDTTAPQKDFTLTDPTTGKEYQKTFKPTNLTAVNVIGDTHHPQFCFTKAYDAGSGMSHYTIVVDNQDYLSNIPYNQPPIGDNGDTRQDGDSVIKENGTWYLKYHLYDQVSQQQEVCAYGKTDAHYLETGLHTWSVKAVDNAGNSIQTDTLKFLVMTNTGTYQKPHQSVWFPLSLLQVGNRTNLTTYSTTTPTLFTEVTKPLIFSDSTPTFYGIAPVGAKIELTLSQDTTDETGTTNRQQITIQSTNANEASEWGINVTTPLTVGDYYLTIQATDTSDNFAMLKDIPLKLTTAQASTVLGATTDTNTDQEGANTEGVLGESDQGTEGEGTEPTPTVKQSSPTPTPTPKQFCIPLINWCW